MIMEDKLTSIQTLLKTLILSVKETYTLDEVAMLTGYKKSYIYNMISKNILPHFKPTGGQVFIEKDDLIAWMKSNKQEVEK